MPLPPEGVASSPTRAGEGVTWHPGSSLPLLLLFVGHVDITWAHPQVSRVFPVDLWSGLGARQLFGWVGYWHHWEGSEGPGTHCQAQMSWWVITWKRLRTQTLVVLSLSLYLSFLLPIHTSIKHAGSPCCRACTGLQ